MQAYKLIGNCRAQNTRFPHSTCSTNRIEQTTKLKLKNKIPKPSQKITKVTLRLEVYNQVDNMINLANPIQLN